MDSDRLDSYRFPCNKPDKEVGCCEECDECIRICPKCGEIMPVIEGVVKKSPELAEFERVLETHWGELPIEVVHAWEHFENITNTKARTN